jgi:hypothetical protein
MNYVEMISEYSDLLKEQLSAFRVTRLYDVIQSFLENEARRVDGVMRIPADAADKSFEIGYRQGVIRESQRVQAFLKNLEARIEHVIKEQRDQRDEKPDDRKVPKDRRPLGRG